MSSGPRAAGEKALRPLIRPSRKWSRTLVTAVGAAVPVSGTRVAAACELHEISLFLSGPVVEGPFYFTWEWARPGFCSVSCGPASRIRTRAQQSGRAERHSSLLF